ncbi:hypothetical protein GBAR_LOCUS3683 [Geodia barretti]|uniref:Uncharacterized protein n=1 Tax=Geodia barretti TaxID=519541 RepID=A0AA35R448_GEOBA|nr:hypothetical protein GBAR_LOCUS3683 [Geodia barretti]
MRVCLQVVVRRSCGEVEQCLCVLLPEVWDECH